MRFVIRYRKIILAVLSVILSVAGSVSFIYKSIEVGNINSGGNVIIGDSYGNR